VTAITCSNLAKSYGAVAAIRDFNLTIDDHEFIVFLGPSGCGKSTLLRMIAGLEDITGGELRFGDRVVNDADPRERGIAMVFQNYALYPHMSIFDNIAFGLRRLGTPAAEIERRVKEVSETLGLEPYLARKPNELSGGQQQRVAIARAMIKTPDVFLFDEPLSNLDAKLRHHMRIEIAKLHQSLKTTTIYVTHDQLEAMTLADRIVLMRAGEIEQVGTPREIYERPMSQFVAGFIGTPPMNLIPAKTRKSEQGWLLDIGAVTLPFDGKRFNLTDGGRVMLGVRPHDLALATTPGQPSISGEIELVEFHGNDALVSVAFNDREISALVPVSTHVSVGSRASLVIDERRVHLFDGDTGSTLLRDVEH
jgi:multiple sugar transport system ATP-binding protein